MVLSILHDNLGRPDSLDLERLQGILAHHYDAIIQQIMGMCCAWVVWGLTSTLTKAEAGFWLLGHVHAGRGDFEQHLLQLGDALLYLARILFCTHGAQVRQDMLACRCTCMAVSAPLLAPDIWLNSAACVRPPAPGFAGCCYPLRSKLCLYQEPLTHLLPSRSAARCVRSMMPTSD